VRRPALLVGGLFALVLGGCTGTGADRLEGLELLGAEVYQANCAGCHGQDGQGQPNWQRRGSDGIYPAPPHDSTGHTWHHADGLLFRIVRDGGQAVYGSPGIVSGMPPFGGQLTDEEIRAVLAYIKRWWGPDEREFQERVSEEDPMP
jgi:mono/diheme cytochrome c family protein